MKYKLINKQTGVEHICEKVVVDGWDYYTEDGNVIKPIDFSKYQYQKGNGLFKDMDNMKQGEVYEVIATNNPSIDIPKVVDYVEIFYKDAYVKHSIKDDKLSLDEQIQRSGGFIVGYKEGYNKSQETHPNSDEDMIGFYRWLNKNSWEDYNDIKQGLFVNTYGVQKQEKELLQLWREQQPKKVYYNE